MASTIRRRTIIVHVFHRFILGQNEKKLSKLQQQNATLVSDANRRMTGQQNQVDASVLFACSCQYQ
jgi:hypothetical protein